MCYILQANLLNQTGAVTDLNKAIVKVEPEDSSCIARVLTNRALHLLPHNLLSIRARPLVVLQAQLRLVLRPAHIAKACQQHCYQSQEEERYPRLGAWKACHCDDDHLQLLLVYATGMAKTML